MNRKTENIEKIKMGANLGRKNGSKPQKKILPKNSFSKHKFQFLTKIRIFDKNFDSRSKFPVSTKFRICNKHLYFRPKFQLSTKICIFDQKLDFASLPVFLTKFFALFDPKFRKYFHPFLKEETD